MEAKELRINNLILDKGVVMKVSGIMKSHMYTCFPSFNEIGYPVNHDVVKPIRLTEEWLIKFNYENWGITISNEYESYKRFVLHNFLSTSNHEVHIITSTYGGTNHIEYVTSIDENERQYNGRMEFVHDLQNAVYKETNKELSIK